MVQVVINKEVKVLSVETLQDLFSALGVDSETYLVKVGDELVSDSFRFNGDEVVEFIRVVSGG